MPVNATKKRFPLLWERLGTSTGAGVDELRRELVQATVDIARLSRRAPCPRCKAFDAEVDALTGVSGDAATVVRGIPPSTATSSRRTPPHP
jgi:hypothetical protein